MSRLGTSALQERRRTLERGTRENRVEATLQELSAAYIHNRRLALALALPAYASVFAAFVIFERPGLGIGHFFYVPICIVALATNERLGALAGALATATYAVAVWASPYISAASILTVSTLIRLVTFAGVGALVGRYATRNRALVDELHRNARLDFLTGVGNARQFDEVLAEHCAAERPFTLVLADLDDFGHVNEVHGHEAGNVALRRVADVLREGSAPDGIVARIGGDEFALVTPVDTVQASELVARLARRLSTENLHLSFGTTAYPEDGAMPIELFRKADDRLFAAKLLNRSRRSVVALVQS